MLSKDHTVLYLVCYDHPANGVYVKGIGNAVKRVSVVGGGELKQHRFMKALWANQPGILIVDLPADAMDPDATVIKIELDGPLSLMGGRE
jgi:alpha-L-fucosidase